jgi:hypothetical protein
MKMKIHKQMIFIGLCSILMLSSCTAHKYLAISDGSKSDGTLTMMYEYGGFEKPVVHWDEAKQSAISKCQSWGFKGAEFFDVGTSVCVAYNQYGCVRWRVTYKCQCTD